MPTLVDARSASAVEPTISTCGARLDGPTGQVSKDSVTTEPLDTDSASSLTSADSVARQLTQRLQAHSRRDDAFWDFAGLRSVRSNGHGIFPYPAMMVPQLQGQLLDDLLAVDSSVTSCYDPFAGSGTVLTECMVRGLNFVGTDLNPLAVLIQLVKCRPVSRRRLLNAYDTVSQARTADQGSVDVSFRGRDKWFTPEAVSALCSLRRAIAGLPKREVRRWFWVALAATVRMVCNSRTSTFKLHAYSPEQQKERRIDVYESFDACVAASMEQISQQWALLTERNLLPGGRYVGRTVSRTADVLDEAQWPDLAPLDVLMTSPPYGDNRTTVSYGQHAFLPLMWIDRRDLPAEADLDYYLASPYRIDVASLGGRRAIDMESVADKLSQRSSSFASAASRLSAAPSTAMHRLVSFTSDLDAFLSLLPTRVKPGAIQFWTVGDRRIGGELIPTTRILAELSQARGAHELITLQRRIPNNMKRMALRNDSVPTMTTESIVVLQTAG